MVDIEPYEYQRKTNVKEHNDIVAKINEIVDVINNTNLDTILPKISKLETDVSTIKATDSLQWTDIENLKTKNTEYDTHFGLNDTQIDGITKSLVSDVAIMNGTTVGNVKIRVGREDAPSIDSNDYNLQKPTSVELVQGSAPAMVKAQITLSDGTVLISDDFMFTTEAIGTDVYISSFVFKNGNVAGTISADIGLSNGSTLTANNFVVPTDPNVTSAISDLQSRMTRVEGGTIVGLNELKQTVEGHTTSISALDSDVADLQIDKADANNGNQTIVAGTVKATNITKGGKNVATVNDIPDISGKVNIAQGTGNAGKVLGINASGNVEPTEITSGGEVWEEIDLNNIPSDWSIGDRIKVEPRIYKPSVPSTATKWTSDISGITYSTSSYRAPLIEFELDSKTAPATTYVPFHMEYSNVMFNISFIRCTLEPNKYTTGSNMFYLGAVTFNGYGLTKISTAVTSSNISNYIIKMWRLKK